jgi:hypothetical protein
MASTLNKTDRKQFIGIEKRRRKDRLTRYQIWGFLISLEMELKRLPRIAELVSEGSGAKSCPFDILDWPFLLVDAWGENKSTASL